MAEGERIAVEVAYALPARQAVIALKVPKGTTALEAIALSGIRERFPDVVVDEAALGIFSRPLNGVDLPLPADYVLAANDRVEIYRPLLTDPKQARLARARKKPPGK